MIPAEIIACKRDQQELSDLQIAFFVQGYSEGSIPDYQMSALAMAILLNGMSERETTTLTQQMLESGDRLAWTEDGTPRVDKHSTGGIGDKISIPLAPLLACCGMQVPMLSGRGLGATGGTLDKLESIPGFRTDLSIEEIQRSAQQVGCVITGTTPELAPADRRLYSLRDVTATVPSIPLITASILSKKLAESPDALVLDVKFGSGAFMKTQKQATTLAHSLVRTARQMGVPTTALLTDMNQPLGRMCGNAVEIRESIEVLQGGGPDDVRCLTIELAAELLVLTGQHSQHQSARTAAARYLDDGSAYEKFCDMVAAQQGRLDDLVEVAPATDVTAATAGTIIRMDTEQLGLAIVDMGGGRKQLGDSIDHSVGLEMLVRVGDFVERGQPLVRLFSRTPTPHIARIQSAISIGVSAEPLELIVGRIGD